MRPLGDWQGQLVRFAGASGGFKPAKRNGQIGYLLQEVQICLYEGCSEAEVRSIDHLWVFITDSELESTSKDFAAKGFDLAKKGTIIQGNATVIRYCRSNGTLDFGLLLMPSSSLVENILVFSDRFNRMPIAERVKSLESAIETIRNKIATLALHVKPAEMITSLEVRLEQERKDLIETQKRLQPPKPKPNPDILPFGKRRKRF